LYKENEELLKIGTYAYGHDKEADKAIELYPRIQQVLKQGTQEQVSMTEILALMEEIIGEV